MTEYRVRQDLIEVELRNGPIAVKYKTPAHILYLTDRQTATFAEAIAEHVKAGRLKVKRKFEQNLRE
jgi:hypothetical protein